MSESVQREINTLRGVAFLFLTLSDGGLFMVLPTGVAEGSPRAAAAHAVRDLKAIQTAQLIFQIGDKDGDGRLQYASSLEALRLANTEGEPDLIDAELATGTKNGYRFTFTKAGSDVFTVNADPIKGGDRRFYPCGGVVA